MKITIQLKHIEKNNALKLQIDLKINLENFHYMLN